MVIYILLLSTVEFSQYLVLVVLHHRCYILSLQLCHVTSMPDVAVHISHTSLGNVCNVRVRPIVMTYSITCNKYNTDGGLFTEGFKNTSQPEQHIDVKHHWINSDKGCKL